MKRIISLFMVLTACCVLFAACGGTGAQQSTETTASAEVKTTEVPAEETTPTDAPAPAESETAEVPAATEVPAPAEAPEEPSEAEPETEAAVLPDGVYQADFDTDSSMFHVNEAHKGKGVLTVQDGVMTIHVTLASKKILNLYAGSAEDAKASDTHLEPTIDSVTYDDGMTEEAYGFDIPVPYLDDEFPCALVGTKGTWYDHMVSVSNPIPMEEVG